MNDQCSPLFKKVFDSGGGSMRECACGKIHFDSSVNGWDWEDGELEKLILNSKAQPGIFVERDGTVSCMEVFGQEIVYGCDCNLAEQWEKNINTHAVKIAEYLNKRAKLMREQADKIEVNEVNEVK